jgi:YVTN family beta-propeller protein
MPHSPLRASVTAALTSAIGAFLAIGCSSSTDSPSPLRTHPKGVIDSVDAGVLSAWGIAIAPSGATILTRFGLGDAVVGRASELTFGPGIPGLPFPLDAAITPDEKRAFVTLAGNSRVAIVDMTTGTHSDDLTTDINTTPAPLRALVTPDGTRVYITTDGDNGEVSDTAANIYAFDAHSLALIDTTVIQGGANGIAYNESTSRLYVSSKRASAVYEIDARTDIVLRKIPVAAGPQDVAISKNHRELWVATEGTTGVQIIELATGVISASIPASGGAFGLAISPDGEQVIVTRPIKLDVLIIDEVSHAVLSTLHTGGSPARVAFDATGEHAYITDIAAGLVRVR